MSNLSISNSSMLAASSVQSLDASFCLPLHSSETSLNAAEQELFKMVLITNNFFMKNNAGNIDINWENVSKKMEFFNCRRSPGYYSRVYYTFAQDVLKKFNPLNNLDSGAIKEDLLRAREQEMIKLLARSYYPSIIVYNPTKRVYELDAQWMSERMALLRFTKEATAISLLFHETIKNLLPVFNPILEKSENKLFPIPELSPISPVSKAIGPSAAFASKPPLLMSMSAPIPLASHGAGKGALIHVSAASYETPSVSGIKRKYSESSAAVESKKNTIEEEAYVYPGYFEEANKLLLQALESPAIKKINTYDYSMDISELKEYSEAVKEALFIRTQLYNPKIQRTAFVIPGEEREKILKIIDDNFHLELKALLELLKSHGYNWTLWELDDFFSNLNTPVRYKYDKFCPRIYITQCSPAALIKMLLMYSQAITEARITGITTLDQAKNPPKLLNIANEISKELNLTAYSTYHIIGKLRHINNPSKAVGKKIQLIASGLGISLLSLQQISEFNKKLSHRGASVPIDNSAEDTSLAVETLFELASGSRTLL